MLIGLDITVLSRTVPNPTGITHHFLGAHADSRVMESVTLIELHFLIRYGFLQSRSVDKSILRAITLRDNGNDSQDGTILMTALLGLQTDSVLNRLVADNLVSGDVYQTDRL